MILFSLSNKVLNAIHSIAGSWSELTIKSVH